MKVLLLQDGVPTLHEVLVYSTASAPLLPLEVVQAVAESPEALGELKREGMVLVARRIKPEVRQ
jgi:hypothetical protein